MLTIGLANQARFAFFLTNTEQFKDQRRTFSLSAEDIARLNPNTRNCPVFRSQKDAEITSGIYRRVPVLWDENKSNGNPWGVKFMRMFDMATDSRLFKLQNDVGLLPLYEGKMCDFFDHRSASYETRGNDRGNRVLPETSLPHHQDPDYKIAPFYWVEEAEVLKALDVNWPFKWFPLFKKVTSPTNERTFLTSVIPMAAAGDSINLVIPNPALGASQISLLIGNLASLVLDFVARQKIGGVNTNNFHVKQLPILPPDHDWSAMKMAIVSRVLELTYSAHDMQSFYIDLMAEHPEYDTRSGGERGQPWIWNPERRAVLRAELDAIYARMYGLCRDDLRYVLDPADVMGMDYPTESFRVLKDREIRNFGEYRTGRLVLEAWDRMEAGQLA